MSQISLHSPLKSPLTSSDPVANEILSFSGRFHLPLQNIKPIFPCRAGFYTLPTNFHRRGVKPRPTSSPIFPCRAGFYTLPTNFLSARYKTAPYIEPNFPCRAGFYTLPTNFLSAGCKTAPYMLIFIGWAGARPSETTIFGSSGSSPSQMRCRD